MPGSDEMMVAEDKGIVVSAGRALVGRRDERSLWGYYFSFENNTGQRVKLVGKDWNITDSRGNRFCDSSAGFRGEIVDLAPGEMFEYSDVAPLEAESAVFYGSCRMLAQGRAEPVDVKIPTFELGVS